jgi:hypothetical protein
VISAIGFSIVLTPSEKRDVSSSRLAPPIAADLVVAGAPLMRLLFFLISRFGERVLEAVSPDFWA